MAKTERQRAIARADTWFSRYIRCKYALNHEYGKCYTSGGIYKLTELDCGHFISRRNLNTRWHMDNARPQCTKDNWFEHGNHSDFRFNLIQDIGKKRVENLEEISRRIVKFSVSEIKQFANFYRVETNKIVKEEGINKWW